MKNLKLVLRSIISNDACIEGGRNRPWWISIIMVFVSIIMTMVPTLVNTLKAKGDDFVNKNTNNYEVSALRFVEEINNAGLEMKVVEKDGKKQLELTKGELKNAEAWNEVFYNVNTSGINCYTHFNVENKIDFQVFYYDGDFDAKYKGADNKNTTFLVQKITSEYFTTKIEKDDGTFEEKTTAVARNSSFIIFGKYAAKSYLYNVNGTQTNSFAGDYKYLENGFTFNSLNENKKSSDIATMGSEEYSAYRSTAWANYKTFFRNSYKSYKVKNVFTQLAIVLGINVGITFFMGVMLFILTRGKANPYRVYNFWETQKMVYWATPTPAVLAMVAGFIFPTFAQVAFPLVIGVRIMWMSMKSLNPQSGSPVFPKAEKKVKEVKAKTVKAKKAK